MGPLETAAQPNTLPGANNVGGLDIGEVTKVGAVTAALAYGMGLLAINTYLHQLGLTDFSFARPKLVLTGVLVLFSFSLLALLPFFVAWRMAGDGQVQRPQSPKILFLLIFPLLALFAASLYLCVGTIGLGQITVWGIWELINQITAWIGWNLAKQRNIFTEVLASLVVTAEVYLPICVAAGFAFVAVRLSRQQEPQQDSPVHPQRIYVFLCVGMAVVAVLAYVIIFSLTFYAAVPQAFGGGKPYFESLVIAEDGRCQLQQLGMPFADGQPNVTVPLPVLHESDNMVAVWLQRKAAQSRNKTGTEEGRADWQTIVVQVDKKEINASMAYPRATTAPKLISPPLPCQSGASSGAAPTAP